jgi:hypothetical protein
MSIVNPKNRTVKRRDVGIAAGVVVISQLISGVNSTQNATNTLEKFKDELNRISVEREQYFVRKVDIVPMNTKLDMVNEQLIRLTEQVASLKNYVKQNYVGLVIEPIESPIRKVKL